MRMFNNYISRLSGLKFVKNLLWEVQSFENKKLQKYMYVLNSSTPSS